MQTNQLKIDAFCRPITPAKNEQPAQPAVPEQPNAPKVPSRKRRIIIHDSDSDEGRAIVQSPGEHSGSNTESSAAMQAPAVTTTGVTVAAAARTVSRTIHTETVTQVRPPNCTHCRTDASTKAQTPIAESEEKHPLEQDAEI